MPDIWVWVVVILLIIGVALLTTYVWRLRRLISRRGSFEGAVMKAGVEKFHPGITVFGKNSLDWYPTVGLGWRPKCSWMRENIELDIRPVTNEALQVVHIHTPEGVWYLATSPIAVSAIVSWIDAAPPMEEPTLF